VDPQAPHYSPPAFDALDAGAVLPFISALILCLVDCMRAHLENLAGQSAALANSVVAFCRHVQKHTCTKRGLCRVYDMCRIFLFLDYRPGSFSHNRLHSFPCGCLGDLCGPSGPQVFLSENIKRSVTAFPGPSKQRFSKCIFKLFHSQLVRQHAISNSSSSNRLSILAENVQGVCIQFSSIQKSFSIRNAEEAALTVSRDSVICVPGDCNSEHVVESAMNTDARVRGKVVPTK